MQPEINIPVAKISPKIKNEDVNNLGIKTLLGKGFLILEVQFQIEYIM